VASDMINLINFGLIASLAIATALLADIVLAPALMVVFSPKDKPLEQPLEKTVEEIGDQLVDQATLN